MIRYDIITGMLLLWMRVYIFLATNKTFQLIFSFCYSNFLYVMFSYDQRLYLTYSFITNNEYSFDEIKDYAKTISTYLEKIPNKQYYGSIDKKTTEILITSFYNSHIKNPEYIMAFLKTLDWVEIHHCYEKKSDILKYILKNIETISLWKKNYIMKKKITAEYIESTKNEAAEHLSIILQNSKSLLIKTSPLLIKENIRHFLDTEDWVYYCKTEDCSSKRFEYLLKFYTQYVIRNTFVDPS